MANRVAVVRGKFLYPTVSANKRYYSESAISNAVERMQKKIETGMPLTMATSHGAAAEDDALSTVGRITSAWQEADGSAWFEADIADTARGRDIAALVAPKEGAPYIKGVSIRGSWIGQPRKVMAPGPNDKEVEAWTADDLDIQGIDFTGRPGVAGAEVVGSLAENRPLNVFQVRESFDEELTFTDMTTESETLEGGNAPGNGKLPYGKVTYADPGYQKDKKKRYPIDTKGHVRAAWSYINKGSNASAYSSAQVARIKSRIKAAAKKFGINIAEESAAFEADLFDAIERYVSAIPDLAEAYACTSISNDDGNISVSGYSGDNDKIANLAKRVCFAAVAALNAFDPDNDGDVDLGGTEGNERPNDDDMESCGGCGDFYESTANFCPACGASTAEATGATATTESEAAGVADTDVSGATTEAAPLTENNDAPAEGNGENTMTTESQAPATFTSESLQALVESAVQKAVKKAAKMEAKEAARAAKRAAAATAPVEATAPAAAAEGAATPAATPAAPTALTEAEVEAIREQAREEARRELVEAMRSTGSVPRKGLVPGASTVQTDSALAEGGDLDPRRLAEMSMTDLRKVLYEAAQSDKVLGKKIAAANEVSTIVG